MVSPFLSFGIKCQSSRSSPLNSKEALAFVSEVRAPRNFEAAAAISSAATCARAVIAQSWRTAIVKVSCKKAGKDFMGAASEEACAKGKLKIDRGLRASASQFLAAYGD